MAMVSSVPLVLINDLRERMQILKKGGGRESILKVFLGMTIARIFSLLLEKRTQRISAVS